MSRYTKRDKYGHAYTNETIYDRGMTSKDGKTYEKHYFENGSSAYDGKPIDRLCELEDKIEQGELVEVVRCKDCKHHPDNGGECDRSITHTSRDYICEVNTYRYIGLEYCSYGERSEE